MHSISVFIILAYGKSFFEGSLVCFSGQLDCGMVKARVWDGVTSGNFDVNSLN